MRVILTLLVLGSLTTIYAQSDDQKMGHGHGRFLKVFYNNLSFSYDIPGSDYEKTPSWDPASEEAPLSMKKVVEIARLNLQRFVKESEKFDIESIFIEEFGTQKWIFQVTFHCWYESCSNSPASFPIFVKLDGTVIEPKITTEKDGDH